MHVYAPLRPVMFMSCMSAWHVCIQDAALVNVDVRQPHIRWAVPGLASLYPHDIALGAAPTTLSGASDRMYALYVAPTCGPPGCGPLRRFVLKPEDAQVGSVMCGWVGRAV